VKTPPPHDAAGTEEAVADDGGSPGDAAACLVGSWVIDPQSVIDMTTASMSMLLGDDVVATPEIEVSGEAVLTFAADGTVTTEYHQQVANVTMEVADQVLRTRSSMDGVLVGRYTATPDELTTSDLDASGITSQSAGTIDGAPFDSGDTQSMSLAAMELGGTMSYTCSGDELRMTPQTPGLGSAFNATYHRA
jgi:hypothetical protein